MRNARPEIVDLLQLAGLADVLPVEVPDVEVDRIRGIRALRRHSIRNSSPGAHFGSGFPTPA